MKPKYRMAVRFVSQKAVRRLEWEKHLSTAEWASANIEMQSDASPMTGALHFDDTPHLIEIFDDFDKLHVYKQLMNASTQVGKTLVLLVAWSKAMSTDPSRMQFTIKNTSDVPVYLEEKVDPFVRGVKILMDKIITLSEEKKKKQRAASMNIAGGGTTFTGTTDAERRSKTVKYLFCDEIALYSKGHFIELEGRTKSYERFFRKILAASSRKYVGDEMDVAYSQAECKKEWHTYCSGCEGHFYAESKHFKLMSKADYMRQMGISEDDFDLSEYRSLAVSGAHLQCPHCGHKIDNSEKDRNIYSRKYKYVVFGNPNGKTIGYKINALATRITSFETIAELWINAKEDADPDTLAQFMIDYFNEFQNTVEDHTESNDLLLLGNGLREWEIPVDTHKIYMGVDVQKDHFWVEVKAFCYGRVSHSIWSGRVESFADVEDVWIRGQSIDDGRGGIWQISKMGIDRRGYNTNEVRRTDEVDAFVEYMVSKYKNGDEYRVYATEGHSVLVGDKAVQIINHRDLSSNRKKMDIKIIKMSNLYLKNLLFRTITRSIETIKTDEVYQTHLFYINQDVIEADSDSLTDKSYTRQLTAEIYDYDRDKYTQKLAKVKTWIRIRKDNHFIDTSVICEAFAEIDKINLALKPVSGNYAKVMSDIAVGIHTT